MYIFRRCNSQQKSVFLIYTGTVKLTDQKVKIALVTSYEQYNLQNSTWHGDKKKIHLKLSSDIACRLHFPSASSLARSLVRLKANVLCHGKRVRVTGSFLRRSCTKIMTASAHVTKVKGNITETIQQRNQVLYQTVHSCLP